MDLRRPVLLVDGRPVAPVRLALDRSSRRRGLLGRTDVEGALLLHPARSVHTFTMTFALDVASCTTDLKVRRVRRVRPGRVTGPRWRQTVTVEAAAGAFERWGLQPGCVLGIRWPSGAPEAAPVGPQAGSPASST